MRAVRLQLWSLSSSLWCCCICLSCGCRLGCCCCCRRCFISCHGSRTSCRRRTCCCRRPLRLAQPRSSAGHYTRLAVQIAVHAGTAALRHVTTDLARTARQAGFGCPLAHLVGVLVGRACCCVGGGSGRKGVCGTGGASRTARTSRARNTNRCFDFGGHCV